MAKLVRVGSEDLPQPSTYIGLTADVVNSARNAKGELIATVIRADVAKVELTWNFLTPEQWSNILLLFKGASNFKQNVTFYNQTTAMRETRTMYVSDRTSSGVWLCDENGEPRGWKGCKLSLIEV